MNYAQAKPITRILIIGTIAVWIVWDIVAVLSGGAPATESATIRSWADLHPAFPWAVGGIMGHFFFNVRHDPTVQNWWTRYRTVIVFPLLAVAMIGLDLWGLFLRAEQALHLYAYGALVPFALGVVSGRLCWPQVVDTTEG